MTDPILFNSKMRIFTSIAHKGLVIFFSLGLLALSTGCTTLGSLVGMSPEEESTASEAGNSEAGDSEAGDSEAGDSAKNNTDSVANPSDDGKVLGNLDPSAVTAKPQQTQKDKTSVQVLWRIPAEKVDGFVLNFGKRADTLDHSIKVSNTELERVNDAQFGSVYRYTLSDVAPQDPIFVSVSAYRNDQTSNPSKILEVAPLQ